MYFIITLIKKPKSDKTTNNFHQEIKTLPHRTACLLIFHFDYHRKALIWCGESNTSRSPDKYSYLDNVLGLAHVIGSLKNR